METKNFVIIVKLILLFCTIQTSANNIGYELLAIKKCGKNQIFRLQYFHISYKTDGCEREITFRITIYWLDNRPENIEEILIVYDREAFLILAKTKRNF